MRKSSPETTPETSAAKVFPIRASFVPPWRFYGRPWWSYLRPRRITLRGPTHIAIYRWLAFNFTIGERQ